MIADSILCLIAATLIMTPVYADHRLPGGPQLCLKYLVKNSRNPLKILTLSP